MSDAEIIKALRNPGKGASATVRWAAAEAIERLTAEVKALSSENVQLQIKLGRPAARSDTP